jgi:glycosyltransferase involved in cell wall biosynthesis
MRLLMIQGGFGAGGAEKVIAWIAAHRAARGDEVHIAGTMGAGEGAYFPVPDTVTLHPLAAAGGGVQLARLRHIRQVIARTRPDAVLSFLTKVNVLTLLAAAGQGCPVIISERNNPRIQVAHRIWHYAQLGLALRARKVVALTRGGLEDLPGWLQARGTVISNPCLPLDPAALRPVGECTELVSVGRLAYQKGFDMLLPAFARLRQMCPQTRLTIYGEGPERARLEALVRSLDLEQSVRLPGVTAEPGGWQRAADLLLMTPRYEGLCNVIAEATVSGIPVISFDCDYGPRDLIRDGVNGLLIAPGDTEGLAAAAARLIAEPQTRAAMRAAAVINQQALEPSRILGQWDRVLDEACRPQALRRQRA